MSSPDYTRLRTPGIGWLTFCRVYIASDHILVVDCSGFEERYRRFLLTDVQAILLRRTAHGWLISLMLALLGGVLLLGGFSVGGQGVIVLGSLSILVFLLLVVNILRGPSCSALLRTRVQAHRINAFSRLSGTRRCLDQLIPLIQQAQSRSDSEPEAST